ncbi:hypothetical protein CC80DRAFT_119289 [Byssothecium circinans]|uniref:Uncharacterized protein n=1 Tax=Byssothecium circinans TaxID=147558 RepID=A0A6A5TP75_9PLEO|nr:hypothetical protein CC80DRAFT_119289 [Byssothecium circinans]
MPSRRCEGPQTRSILFHPTALFYLSYSTQPHHHLSQYTTTAPPLFTAERASPFSFFLPSFGGHEMKRRFPTSTPTLCYAYIFFLGGGGGVRFFPSITSICTKTTCV